MYAAVKWLTDEGGPVDAPSVLARLVATEAGVWRTGQAGVILAGLLEQPTRRMWRMPGKCWPGPVSGTRRRR